MILAGGSGTRLWPLSRVAAPEAVPLARCRRRQRRRDAVPAVGAPRRCARRRRHRRAAPCIVANEEHRFTVVEQLRDIGIEAARVLLEPSGRNTAPALQLAALRGRACCERRRRPDPHRHAPPITRSPAAPTSRRRCARRCAPPRSAASSFSASGRSGRTPATATSAPAR